MTVNRKDLENTSRCLETDRRGTRRSKTNSQTHFIEGQLTCSRFLLTPLVIIAASATKNSTAATITTFTASTTITNIIMYGNHTLLLLVVAVTTSIITTVAIPHYLLSLLLSTASISHYFVYEHSRLKMQKWDILWINRQKCGKTNEGTLQKDTKYQDNICPQVLGQTKPPVTLIYIDPIR